MILIAALVVFLIPIALSGPMHQRGESSVASRTATVAAWTLNAVGCVVMVVAGVLALSGRPVRWSLGDLGGLGQTGVGLDRLSGMFAIICFGVALPAVVTAFGPQLANRLRLPALMGLTLLAMLFVLAADHLFVLMFGWELLTVAFYLLAGFDHDRPGRARASVIAAGFGKVSGATLLAGGLLLTGRAHSFLVADWGTAAGDALGQVSYALLLAGFAVKVGLVPVQVWLPPTYTSAPPAARAIMAGAAVNVGFYGTWRTLDVLGPPPTWLAVVVLVIGGLTAVLGIAHAAVHPRLTGLIAWSSVENAGLIVSGFGVALVGAAVGQPRLEAAGLLAATAQVITHALAKSLLFAATSVVESAAGTTRLDDLRGLCRTLPWAGTGLVLGSLTLAGLPLTAGFTSEWLILEALMQRFRVADTALQLACAFAGALVALTVGVAGVTFVRLVGLTAFGTPSTALPNGSADRAPGHRIGVSTLALACLGVAVITPWEVRFVAAGLRPLVDTQVNRALASPWVIQPVFADFSALSPTWLWLIMPLATVVVILLAASFSGARLWRVRRVAAWSSASPGVDRGPGYTSFAFANPLRRVLANLLLTRSQLEELSREQHRTPPRSGTHRPVRTSPGVSEQAGLRPVGASTSGETNLQYRVDVVEVVERYVYRPLAGLLLGTARWALRLQSGRLDAYMTYMLIALVAVLAVVTAVS